MLLYGYRYKNAVVFRLQDIDLEEEEDEEAIIERRRQERQQLMQVSTKYMLRETSFKVKDTAVLYQKQIVLSLDSYSHQKC